MFLFTVTTDWLDESATKSAKKEMSHSTVATAIFLYFYHFIPSPFTDRVFQLFLKHSLFVSGLCGGHRKGKPLICSRCLIHFLCLLHSSNPCPPSVIPVYGTPGNVQQKRGEQVGIMGQQKGGGRGVGQHKYGVSLRARLIFYPTFSFAFFVSNYMSSSAVVVKTQYPAENKGEALIRGTVVIVWGECGTWSGRSVWDQLLLGNSNEGGEYNGEGQ